MCAPLEPGTTILGTAVITTTATIIIYATHPRQQVILENYDWRDLSAVTLTLRDVGPAQVTLADWFIDGQPPTEIPASCTLSPGSTCTVSLIPRESISNALSAINVVAVDGQVFSYCLIAGSAGLPLSDYCNQSSKVIMTAYNWQDMTSLVLTLWNAGPLQVSFAYWLVNGIAPTEADGTCVNPTTGVILSESSCRVTLTVNASNISAGVTYECHLSTGLGYMG